MPGGLCSSPGTPRLAPGPLTRGPLPKASGLLQGCIAQAFVCLRTVSAGQEERGTYSRDMRRQAAFGPQGQRGASPAGGLGLGAWEPCWLVAVLRPGMAHSAPGRHSGCALAAA